MAEGQKATQLAECEVTSGSLDLSLKPEAISFSSPNFEEPVSMPSPSRPQPPGLLSMPCLLKELRQDSPPEAVPPQKGPSTSVIQICLQEDSDSSACLRSPSSSGHLGDSDTLSSLEEDVGLADAKPAPSSQSEPARRKSSRRSRSESDASAGVAMVAKKNRCQERQPNGGRNRERGKRSQRHKERIRLLRQKREAVAKRKSRPLEDSSTSDSDATAHSSSSPSSSSDEGDTVRLHPPGPVEVAPPHVSLPLSDSEVEIVGVKENTSAVTRFPRGGVIQSLSAWKQTAMPHWTAVSAQPDWASPPEVVDLTLDEDRHRYLL